MNPSLIPTPDTLPVSWLWFEILLLVTFILHLIFMNLILGGSLLALFDRKTGRKTDLFSRDIPLMVALAINLGVPPLLFVQVLYGQFFYTSSVLMALFWILVIPLLILAYYGTYIYVKHKNRASVWTRITLGVATLFLLYIAFMFVNNSTLAIQPADWLTYFTNQKGTLLHLSDPSLWPRYLHFILASIAIAAIGKSLFFHYSKSLSPEEKSPLIRRNLKIVAWATLVQIAVGTWFWIAMPKPVFMLFMGKSLISTIMMGVSWLGAIGLVITGFKGKLHGTLMLGLLQMVLMVLIRDITRNAYLEGVFHPSGMQVVNQPSSLIAFLIVFGIGIGVLAYMINLSIHSQNKES